MASKAHSRLCRSPGRDKPLLPCLHSWNLWLAELVVPNPSLLKPSGSIMPSPLPSRSEPMSPPKSHSTNLAPTHLLSCKVCPGCQLCFYVTEMNPCTLLYSFPGLVQDGGQQQSSATYISSDWRVPEFLGVPGLGRRQGRFPHCSLCSNPGDRGGKKAVEQCFAPFPRPTLPHVQQGRGARFG